MNSFVSFFLAFIVVSTTFLYADASSNGVGDFELTEEEKREINRIKKLKKSFFQKYPGWFESYEDVPFVDIRLEQKIEKRKAEHIKRKKIEEEEKRAKTQKELDEKRLKAEQELEEKRKKEEALKKLAETPLGKAMRLFKEQKFKEAYDAFYKLFEEDVGNARINFYLGLSASNAKMYDEAVSAFERVLINEPNHLRARLEFAKAHFFLKNFEEAETEFIKVLQNKDLPEPVIVSINKFLDIIETTKNRNHFQSIAMVGLKYDNNINNDVGENTPINDLADDWQVFEAQMEGFAPVSDAMHEEMYNLNHIYDFGRLGDYFMQNSFLIFAQNYSGKEYKQDTETLSTDDKNLIFSSVSSGIGTKTKNVNFLIKAHYDAINLAGEEIMSVVGLEMNYARPYSQNITWDTKWKYQNKDVAANDDGDSGYMELNLGMKRNDPETKDVIAFNLGISQERANVAANTDNDIMNLRALYTKAFSDKLSSTAGYTYKTIDYLEKSPIDKNVRADTQHNFTLSSMYKYNLSTMINGTANYIMNDSSRDSFTYDKFQVGANVMFIF